MRNEEDVQRPIPALHHRASKYAAIAMLLALPLTACAQQDDAVNVAAINYTDPLQIMRQGGPLMWPLLICSIATITFGLERFVSLRRSRVIPRGFVQRFFQGLRSGEFDRVTAIAFCKLHPNAIAALFASALRHWGRPAAEIHLAVQEAGERELMALRRNMRALQAMANIGTLLGLLGTVTGMIEAFNSVAMSQKLGRAELLSHGISVALFNTAFGLVIAILSVFLYNYFASRVERLVYEMNGLVGDLVDGIAADGRLAQPAPTVAAFPGPKPSVHFAS